MLTIRQQTVGVSRQVQELKGDEQERKRGRVS